MFQRSESVRVPRQLPFGQTDGSDSTKLRALLDICCDLPHVRVRSELDLSAGVGSW